MNDQNPWISNDHDPTSLVEADREVIVRITYGGMRFENTVAARDVNDTLARMYARHSIVPAKRDHLRGTCRLTRQRVKASILPAPATSACGWNACTRPGRAQYDGRCARHEWSQCRTPECAGDADDATSERGYCPTCERGHRRSA